MFTKKNLNDMEAGYKFITREVYRWISIEEDRFVFDPENTSKLVKVGDWVYDVKIDYSGRSYSKGRKIGWEDGVSAIRCILNYNLFQ